MSLYLVKNQIVFCEARDNFMELLVKGGEPSNARKNLIAKYTLLAEAKKMAFNSPSVPLETNVTTKG